MYQTNILIIRHIYCFTSKHAVNIFNLCEPIYVVIIKIKSIRISSFFFHPSIRFQMRFFFSSPCAIQTHDANALRLWQLIWRKPRVLLLRTHIQSSVRISPISINCSAGTRVTTKQNANRLSSCIATAGNWANLCKLHQPIFFKLSYQVAVKRRKNCFCTRNWKSSENEWKSWKTTEGYSRARRFGQKVEGSQRVCGKGEWFRKIFR